MAKCSLKEWREIIAREVSSVDAKQYSHNIISIALSAIDKEHGETAANQAIDDFELEKLGWHKKQTAHVAPG